MGRMANRNVLRWATNPRQPCCGHPFGPAPPGRSSRKLKGGRWTLGGAVGPRLRQPKRGVRPSRGLISIGGSGPLARPRTRTTW